MPATAVADEAPELVAEIRKLLDAGGREPDQVEAELLAAGYRRLYEELNDRLSRCREYLEQHLRSEALHLASVAPDVRERAAELAKVPQEKWSAFCERYELEPAPQLLGDVVEALEAAEAAEAPLRPLLKQWRRMALEGVSVSDRFALLLRIAEQDPENPLWQAERQRFERARLRELQGLRDTIRDSDDLAFCQGLLQELTDPDRQVAAPQDLLNDLRGTIQQIQKQAMDRELKRLIAELKKAAHEDGDYAKCQELLEHWEDVEERHGLPVPPLRKAERSSVKKWMRKHEAEQAKRAEFDEACADLEQGLEANLPVDELSRRLLAAQAFGIEMPAELERAVMNRLQADELSRRRRGRLVVLAGLMVTAGLLAAGTWQVMDYVAEMEAQRWAEGIQKLLAAEELAEAEARFAALQEEKPGLLEHERLVSLRQELTERQEAEAARQRRFAELMEQVESAGVDEPARDALSQAATLAETEAERARLSLFREKLSEAEARRQAERDRTFRRDVAALQREVAELGEFEISLDPEAFESKLGQREQAAAELRSRAGISPGAREEMEPVRRALGGLRRDLNKVQERQAAEEALAEASEQMVELLDRPALLASRLQELAELYPGTIRGSDFGRAARQVRGWLGMQQWDVLSDGWGNDLIPPDAMTAGRHAEQVRQYLLRYPSFPLSESVETYAGYLESASAALSPTGPWRGDLKAFVDRPQMRKLKILPVVEGEESGRVYYTIGFGDYVSTHVGKRVKVVAAADLSEQQQKEFRSKEIGKPEKAPQTMVAEQLDAMLKKLGPKSWSTFGLRAMRVVQGAKDLDPLARFALLSLIRDGLEAANWQVAGPADELNEALEGLSVPRDGWVTPLDDRVEPGLRERVSRSLNRLPPVGPVIESVSETEKQMLATLGFDVVARGLMLVEQDGVRVRLPEEAPDPLPEGAKLVTVLASEEGLREIGEVVDGKPRVEFGLRLGVAQGSIIFIIRYNQPRHGKR